jgi:hypothetical protein
MANFNADLQTNLVATPPVRSKVNRLNGRLRVLRAQYTVPAVPPAIADTITWGPLPVGARTIGYLSQLNCGVGNALSTLNLGDVASVARHLAASSVATAALFVPNVAEVNGAQFETSDGSTSATTNNCNLISTVAGAALLAGQVITLTMVYVTD